jgi:hypothetical protein
MVLALKVSELKPRGAYSMLNQVHKTVPRIKVNLSLCLTKHHAMKMYLGVQCMHMSGKLQDPTASHPGKEPPVAIV